MTAERASGPVGAVSTHQVQLGERCQGNINCVPLCPVQAKYNAGKTLARAFQTGRVDLLAQTVASKVLIDENGRVSGIEYKTYHDPNSLGARRRHRARTGLRPIGERDRERTPDARLGADQRERPDGPQPDGSRLPAELGAAARECRHDARDRLHGRDPGPADRPLPPAPGRLLRRHPQRRLGLGGGLSVHRCPRAGRLLEPVRLVAAHHARRANPASASARVHDRGAAEPEQPGQHRSGLQGPAREHAAGRVLLASPTTR